ncbi:MAG TPA: LysR family transcriptional regulator [Myxococcota bacterium]|nr:LysR family transcriptional regulator [Myxococcota bacterium]
MELSELAVFLKVAQTTSLSRAARELGLPRATVGRRLERLESSLGLRLIRRSTRKLVLTEAGEILFQRGLKIQAEIEDTRRQLQSQEDRIEGELKVLAPPIQSPSFAKMICTFQTSYPRIRLQLYMGTPVVDLLASGYDLAIRAAPVTEGGLVQRVLRRSRLVLVGAPALFDRLGIPGSVGDLSHFPCILGFDRGELPRSTWPLRSGGSFRVEGRLVTNDLELQLESARAGLGLALLPEMRIGAELASGRLLRVLEQEVGGESQLVLLYPERAQLPAKVRVFVDAVVGWAAGELV